MPLKIKVAVRNDFNPNIEGTVSVRHKGVMIDSNLETIHSVVLSDVKEKVTQVVGEEEMTLKDFVKYCIEKELRARGLL